MTDVELFFTSRNFINIVLFSDFSASQGWSPLSTEDCGMIRIDTGLVGQGEEHMFTKFQPSVTPLGHPICKNFKIDSMKTFK